jgi:2-amino-4-hydroxy-6-hydroxymethyldihydropteridine diphosphokinase
VGESAAPRSAPTSDPVPTGTPPSAPSDSGSCSGSSPSSAGSTPALASFASLGLSEPTRTVPPTFVPPQPVHAYIALGSNLGDRAAHLRFALTTLAATPGFFLLRVSRFHETAPVGGPPGQGPYLNAAALLSTTLSPRALLDTLLDIESRAGRTRSVPNAPRTLDLDLLLYADLAITTPDLQVPHPRMWTRSFVVEPLAECVARPRG